MAHQESFRRVAPVIGAALLIGTGGGFALAAVLTLTTMLGLVTGPWWLALAQAHGHLQLYGWAGLFVIGVALHFVPRLRGNPLARPQLVPWFLGALVASLLLRALCQPLATLPNSAIWRVALMASGVLEGAALLGIVSLIALTLAHGPKLTLRPAFRGVVPLVTTAFFPPCPALWSIRSRWPGSVGLPDGESLARAARSRLPLRCARHVACSSL